MSVPVLVPAVGESISSGVLSAWHKKDGDHVSVGDLLFTLDTDKVSSEVTALEAGVLKITVAEGAEVPIGSAVGEIDTAAKAPAAKVEEKKPEAKKEEASAPKAEAPKPAAPAPVAPAAPPAPRPVPEGRVSRRKLTPLRRKIAMQLVNAQQTAAILTTFNEVDMSAVMNLRKDVQEGFQAKHGVKLGFMSFFIKATVDALQAVPQINAQLEGDELIENHYYDIGVAVGTEKGLVVPVIRGCETLSLAGLEKELLGYAVKAREGKIGLSDLQGGCFTISNGGVYGSLLSTPILNPPQSGILGMHKIQERPVAINGKVEIRPMMYLALSYDHRVVDGKEAVTFLIKIKEALENPVRLFLD
ncbi:MAG: dihydrolipoyllysine-residue succinyltransferase [Proteobacteria bacterium]|nr:dihydrolipoyllysine-residue succinyltransferase [Pseudomonadota bacterium]